MGVVCGESGGVSVQETVQFCALRITKLSVSFWLSVFVCGCMFRDCVDVFFFSGDSSG